jgi:hypothetical protein
MRLRCLTAGLMLIGFVSASSAAQSTENAGLVRIKNTSYIALNPLIVPFDLGSAEFETGVAQGTTVGAGVSYIDVDDQRYTSADFKVRYYPGEVVLRGFSVGFTAGYLRYSVARANFPDSTDRATLDAPTIGIVTDFNWLLGGNKRFLVGTGLGAKRVLSSKDERQKVDLNRAYVTARFVVGLAF